MAQKKEEERKLAQLSALYLTLDGKSRNKALSILKALEFTQTAIASPLHSELFTTQQKIALHKI